MEAGKIFKERIKFFIIGALAVAGAIFLMGANSSDTIVLDNGRYQISAWGNSRAYGAFVLDTVTGETKVAYKYFDGEDSAPAKEKNNLNVPFNSIK